MAGISSTVAKEKRVALFFGALFVVADVLALWAELTLNTLRLAQNFTFTLGVGEATVVIQAKSLLLLRR